MHLAPRGDVGTMGDSDAAVTFGYVARELDKRTSAFIAAAESLGDKRLGSQLNAAFSGPYIANEKFTRESAQQVLDAGEAVALAWGQLFIAIRQRSSPSTTPPSTSVSTA
jgi:hypothetical protein